MHKNNHYSQLISKIGSESGHNRLVDHTFNGIKGSANAQVSTQYYHNKIGDCSIIVECI